MVLWYYVYMDITFYCYMFETLLNYSFFCLFPVHEIFAEVGEQPNTLPHRLSEEERIRSFQGHDMLLA